jgi:cbb3-type cytochrome oxidase subunit 3
MIILLVGGTFYMFNKKSNTNNEEVPYAAGMNFDLEK